MKQPEIIVVGSANVDLVTRVPRCPKPGESLIGSAFCTVPGGKGANQAVAAARLGATTHFAGCVGDDAFGEMQRQTLAADGIDLAHLKIHASESTGTAVILVADEGQNLIIVTPSANYGILPEDIEAMAPVFERADTVLVQLEIPLDTVEAALDMARRTGTLSILDAGPAQAVSKELLAKADVVSPNETEAEAMTGVTVRSVDDAREAAGRLRTSGTAEIVVKLGAMGALYVGDGDLHMPAFTVDAVDTVAAGDAFTAALALRWNQVPHAEALRFANAAGALATTNEGAQPSMPTVEAVEAFLTERSDQK